jgi:hypothetical protein
MNAEFITYQRFTEIAFADMLVMLLEENDIPFEMEEQGPSFNPSFSFREDMTSYAVKVRSEDFERVNQLLAQAEEAAEPVTGDDYYLYDFTNDELMEVLKQADEWSAFDVSLARKILADRGKPVSDDEFEKIRNKRLDDLKQPETSKQIWITIGYISAFLGGVLGIFIGWVIFKHKKTLPNGERVYSYSESDRKHGKIIFYVGLISTVLWIAWRIINVMRGYQLILPG